LKREFGYTGIDVGAEATYSLSDLNNIKFGVDYTTEDQELQNVYEVYLKDFGQNKAGDKKLAAGTEELGSKTFSNMGVFTQAMYYPMDQLGITGGLRFDNHNIYGSVINYRTALVYKFSENTYLKGLYGTSFKAPASTQLYTNNYVAQGIRGNEDLEPEKATTAEISVGTTLMDKISIQVSGFFNRIKNKVDFADNATNSNKIAKNLSELKSFGFEGEVLYREKNYGARATISYQKTNEDNEALTDDEKKVGQYPVLQFYTAIDYDLSFLRTALEFQFIGKVKGSEDNIKQNLQEIYDLNSYQLLNLTLSSKKIALFSSAHKTLFRLRVTNILGTDYIVPGYKGFDIPGEKRNLFFTIQQNF